MKIAIFGGSFDPVHKEHLRLVQTAIAHLSLDKMIIMPSRIAPHKLNGAFASEKARFEMCKLAFSGENKVEVSDFELMRAQTSYTYLTCRALHEQYPNDQLYWLVGADMLEDFFGWKNPEDILKNVTLVACGRGSVAVSAFHKKFFERFQRDFIELPFTGEEVSSTRLRIDVAFGKENGAMLPQVANYIRENSLYAHPAIAPALTLEKEERREHSYRVAKMATARARSLGLSESKALLASALHDCGKYVPLTSPLLKDFTLPQGVVEPVPAPVLHQFTGAYLAEHFLHVEDSEVLDAVRYHTSGKVNMSVFEKLIFLADLLEEGRSYRGVEELRALFYTDFEGCFVRALREQCAYLESTGVPVYPLTKDTYLWARGQ